MGFFFDQQGTAFTHIDGSMNGPGTFLGSNRNLIISDNCVFLLRAVKVPSQSNY